MNSLKMVKKSEWGLCSLTEVIEAECRNTEIILSSESHSSVLATTAYLPAYSSSNLANLSQTVVSAKHSYPLVELIYSSSLHFNRISVRNMQLGEHSKGTAAVDETG